MNKILLINKYIFKRKSNFIAIFIITLLFLLFFYLINFSLIVGKYLYNEQNYDIAKRTLIVYTNDNNDYIKKLSNINHVTQVNNFNILDIYFHSDKYSDIKFHLIKDKELEKLKIIKGEKKLENYNVICPKEFIPIDDPFFEIKINNEKYDTNKLINTKFNVTLKKEMLENGIFKIVDTKSIDFTIIGNYDNTKYMLDFNTCLISEDDAKSLYEFDGTLENYAYAIIVDNIKNIDYVYDELEKEHFDVHKQVNPNVDTIIILSIIVTFIIIGSVFLFVTVIKFIAKHDIIKKEKEILLYKSIGYNNIDIKNIYAFEYFIIFVTAVIISTVIFIITSGFISYNINSYVTYKLMNIHIDYLSIIISIIICIILAELVINVSIAKILKRREIKL